MGISCELGSEMSVYLITVALILRACIRARIKLEVRRSRRLKRAEVQSFRAPQKLLETPGANNGSNIRSCRLLRRRGTPVGTCIDVAIILHVE